MSSTATVWNVVFQLFSGRFSCMPASQLSASSSFSSFCQRLKWVAAVGLGIRSFALRSFALSLFRSCRSCRSFKKSDSLFFVKNRANRTKKFTKKPKKEFHRDQNGTAQFIPVTIYPWGNCGLFKIKQIKKYIIWARNLL